jgi:dipeptidyl aminopeptidase/acylaminoacyl peptidase
MHNDIVAERSVSMSNQKHSIQPEDLFKLKFIQSSALSPDGKKVIYQLERVDPEELEAYTSLWLLDVESGEERQFTSEKTGGGNPSWSPDGKQIAFVAPYEDVPQIYVMPADGGEAHAITKVKQGVGSGPAWSPDGRNIAFTAEPAQEEEHDPKKPYRVTRKIYRIDDFGYLQNCVQDIYVIPADGGEPKQLTKDDWNNREALWSPDSKEILFTADFAPDSFNTDKVLKSVDLEGIVREVTGDWGSVMKAAWLPDSSGIAFIGEPHGLTIGSKHDLWVVPRSGGKPECRTAGLKVGVGGKLQSDMPLMLPLTLAISEDCNNAYLDVQEGGNIHIYEIGLNGEENWRTVIGNDRAAALVDKAGDHLLYSASSFNNPIDLYISDLEGKNQEQLTRINEEIIESWKLPEVEHLLYPGVDGVQVEGWLMKPSEGEAPYPTVLYIHGGPHLAFGSTFYFDFHLLTGAGFAVLLINHRASSGYSDEFSTAIKGDWGNLDYHDLMSGVDYVIEKGLVDGDRMGVCGISGGGNLSSWIIGQTDRFKAAVPENPITNWLSFYGVSDIGPWLAVEELGGHPHEIPEVYKKCSPITYAHRCTTPTLFVQGESDFRCPPEQSEQFYTILKANGCITEMVRLPNSPHLGSFYGDPEVRKYQNEVLLDWMNRYVLGKTKVE